jgi:S-adenosyl-L-methionine hydrolase (adenosine-forming)
LARKFIALFTDFGLTGPYTGQMKAVLLRDAPDAAVVDLFADAPSARPQPAAHLLAAYATWFPPGTVFLCVVDPGVGGPRTPLIVQADRRWYVGPDNGLFEQVLRRAANTQAWRITFKPAVLSASFHGRDLFAPVAARLARGDKPPGKPHPPTRFPTWPDELDEIVYVDHYGNAITGLRAAALPPDARLGIAGDVLPRMRTFSDLPIGAAFCYQNANGLMEVAVNGGRADAVLGLAVGSKLTVVP